MVNITIKKTLKDLGQRLKEARLLKDDSQKEFAVRIGVSIPTLHKMEKGSPAISIGIWAETLRMFNRLEDINQILLPPESLFEKYRARKKIKTRQRATRKSIKDETA